MLDIQEILRKVRLIEILTRKAVNERLAGTYQSAFKGMGVEFSDVRPYQPGDDFRLIDWNVTSRTGQVFIKQFHEERQMTLLFAVDVSASMHFGTTGRLKSQAVAEVCALLAFSAIRNQDKVGLLLFSEGVELYLPPRKGREHVLRLIREVLYFTPRSRGTNFEGLYSSISKLLTRRASVFICSDFMASLGRGLPALAKHHDLTAVWIEDPTELELPRSGWTEIIDPETGGKGWVNLSSRKLAESYRKLASKRQKDIRQAILKSGADMLQLQTGADPVMPLIAYMQARAKRKAA